MSFDELSGAEDDDREEGSTKERDLFPFAVLEFVLF